MGPRALGVIPCGLVLLFLSTVAAAQQRPGPPTAPGPPQQRPFPPIGPATGTESTGTVVVYIRDENGARLPDNVFPRIQIESPMSPSPVSPIPRNEGNGWSFAGLGVGREYEVVVQADGYEDAHETVALPEIPGSTSSVTIFLRPVNEALIFRAPTGQFLLAPKAQKEVQSALKDLRAGKNAAARKHAEKALRLAPGNPFVQYVVGTAFLMANDLDQAKPHLEQAVSIDPKRPAALLALGTLRFRQGDDAGAIAVLTKATELDASSWQAEWVLAASYLREQRYADSRLHAEEALKSGKERAGPLLLVLAQALEELGERQKAAAAFEQFAAQYPHDRNAAPARRRAAELRREPANPVAVMSHTSEDAAPPPSGLLRLVPPASALDVSPPGHWAPPDVDSVTPVVLSDKTCDLPALLKTTESKTEEFVSNLEKFSATEDYEATEFKADGQVEKPVSRKYSYIVFIDSPSSGVLHVREWRGDGDSSTSMRLPGRIQDLGAPGLVLAFHRRFHDDFDWTCEGLGRWRDQPAWIVHFQQRTDRPTSLLAGFDTPSREFALALKGRAWVAEKGGQVLHLETDLMKPLLPVDFRREHFAIDYAPVQFPTHKVELWLPENVDVYMQYRGHFLHYYHHFRDFKLFWVGATQKIAGPKQETVPE
jgi:tetratricopeptide (TPR) repeat protein